MKYVKTLLIILFLFLLNSANAQMFKSKIAKVGYASDFMPLQESGHYSLHFDLESSTNNHFITNEFGAGFLRNGTDLYYAKFDYKFYPISAIFKNHRYQGIYLSLGPGVFYEDLSRQKLDNRFGLGIFTTGGLQLFLHNRISVAFELEMDLVSNLNSQTESGSNESNHKAFFTNSFKIGYVFNRKSQIP